MKEVVIVIGEVCERRKMMVKIVMCSARTSHEPIFIVEAASSMLVSKEIFFDRVARTHRSVVRSRAKLNLHRSQPDTSEQQVLFYTQLFSQSLEDDVTLRRHTPACSEDQRVEVSVLDV